jgi:hypothetical protein
VTPIRFWPWNTCPAVMCSRCCALVVDDDEGVNRREHEAWHEDVERRG